jgi:hypothetical protein
MESTLCVLEILNGQGFESISEKELSSFLNPFKNMVKFQIEFKSNKPRFKGIK